MSISNRALLAFPALSVWTARKFDRVVSEKVAKENQTKARRAGRYNKCLIDVESILYTRVKAIEGMARRYHETHTLPWSQDGARILPGEMYYEYVAKMNGFSDDFSHAVKEFLEAYPAMVEAAKGDLNGLYNDSDYPTVGELRDKFSFRVSFFPVPETKEDFRIEALGDNDIAKLRTSIEDDVKKAVAEAAMERWARLLDVVGHAVNKLSSPDAVFRDSLIGNIREAVKTLPKLSIVEDKEFDRVLKDVETHLAKKDPELFRNDQDARKKAALKAQEIAQKMSAFMGR